MKKIALVLLVISMIDLAHADKIPLPSNVGVMIMEDSNFALIKNAEISITSFAQDGYLMRISKIPRVPDRIGETVFMSSEVAACLADYLSYRNGKKFWSVGYSMQARDAYETGQGSQLDYYILVGRKPDKQLQDAAGRELDTWNDRDREYPPYGYKKKHCEPYKIKPEWLSWWETFRRPVGYSNIAGERLPNRIWTFHNQTVLDSWSKSEEMLPVINAEVSLHEINSRLFSVKIYFDGAARGMAAMYSLMMFPNCLANYLAHKNGFELSDAGMANLVAAKAEGGTRSSEDVISIEYYLLLDVRENEPRPVVAGVDKIGWVGASASIGRMRSVKANIAAACQKIMAPDFLPRQ